jgi:protein Mpv17
MTSSFARIAHRSVFITPAAAALLISSKSSEQASGRACQGLVARASNSTLALAAARQHPRAWISSNSNSKSNHVNNGSSSFNQWVSQQRRLLTTTKATSDKPSSGFLPWYEGHLQARPVATKMVTGGILWSIGDAVGQIVPQLASSSSSSSSSMAASESSSSSSSNNNIITLHYDYMRTARAGFFGCAIHAPTSHLHFNFLEYLTVRANVTGLKIPVFKAFMEQFVYWSWISNSMYHGAMGAMQGQSPTQIYERIEAVLWETQKAQWVFWIPIQLLNFRFVPVRHQLNVVLLTSIVWTALLSAWYPPEPERMNTQKKELVDE